MHNNLLPSDSFLFSERAIPLHEPSKDHALSELYRSLISHTIEKSLSPALFPSCNTNLDAFYKELPFLSWKWNSDDTPCDISFVLLCRFRLNAFKFFYEMITHWLIPGKYFNAAHFFVSNFRFTSGPSGEYSVGEVMIHIEDPADLKTLKKNLPFVASEIRRGISSKYRAQQILEIKGLSCDEKTAAIYEHITALIERHSLDITSDIFNVMKHTLVICSEVFKTAHSSLHISRIITTTYLFKKLIFKKIEKQPEKRHVFTKVIRTLVSHEGAKIPAIGVLITMNILDNNESFEEQHLLKAIQRSIPEAHPIPGSFFTDTTKKTSLRTLYLDIFKKNQQPFSLAESQLLRTALPIALDDSIEHLIHPIFMPDNEEETMHKIVTLSSQLRYMRDIPQVIISFDKQSKAFFTFSVTLLRILKKDTIPLKKLFKLSDSFMKFIPERTKHVGMLRKQYPKEANIFRLALKKHDFMRSDHSLDIARARRAVVVEMTRIIGSFRDYNGGMIRKEGERFSLLKSSFSSSQQKNDLLLENFFYSLTPIVARTVSDLTKLKKLFLMLLEAIGESPSTKPIFAMMTKNESEALFVMITTNDSSLKEKIGQKLIPLHDSHLRIVSSSVSHLGASYLGYIYISDNGPKRKQFLDMLISF